jgi:hypothetical protein
VFKRVLTPATSRNERTGQATVRSAPQNANLALIGTLKGNGNVRKFGDPMESRNGEIRAYGKVETSRLSSSGPLCMLDDVSFLSNIWILSATFH